MLNTYLNAMKSAATECGSIMLDRSAIAMNINSKSSHRDVVTQYDFEVQSALVKRLSVSFPEASFVTEETPERNTLTNGTVFVIDPIDGTMNFVKNYHHSCISIGCFIGGTPAAAVVYDPYKKELFYAAKGMGAFLNGSPIFVTDDPLADTLILFGTSPYNTETADQTFANLQALYHKCLDLRRTGSAALDLCYVACGRAGLYFEARLSLWDYAAGTLILTEAGGIAMKLDGSPLDFSLKKSSILVGSQRCIVQSGLVQGDL